MGIDDCEAFVICCFRFYQWIPCGNEATENGYKKKIGLDPSCCKTKVSKKDDKVDLNESSAKYTKIYLNSNISSFQFRKVWCCLHWVKLRFYDLFAAESVSQQCWSKWATKLKFCWVFSNQQQNLRAKRTGNFSLGIFFWIRKHKHKKSCKLFLTKNP